MARVEFDESSATRFEFINGRRPRGFGLWSFTLGRNGSWTKFQYTGTYTEAKHEAISLARSLGCDTVIVNP